MIRVTRNVFLDPGVVVKAGEVLDEGSKLAAVLPADAVETIPDDDEPDGENSPRA